MFFADALFLLVLLVNTLFSVRFFEKLIQRDGLQLAIDLALIWFYGALFFTLGEPLWFPFFATGFFILATLKYAVLLEVLPHVNLLKRKISLDLLGAIMAASALCGALKGYPLEAAWVMAVIFMLANLYLLFMRPMYRL